jgi:hypothetical protein
MNIPDQCPHCDEGVTVPRDRLDDHIAEVHADLPPCTARISSAATENQTVRCVFRVRHYDEYGDQHAGRDERNGGRFRWGDNTIGAVPHEPQPDETWPEQPPELSESNELRADNESLRYQILRAREALGTDEPVDDRLRRAEIRAAIAEHEAEAYRKQVQALVRELLRAREVPEEDLPQKVRVIILDEEAP